MDKREKEPTEEEATDEGAKRAEESGKDTEGHTYRAGWREGDSEPDEEKGDEGEGKDKGRFGSDARLKRQIEPISGALEGLRGPGA